MNLLESKPVKFSVSNLLTILVCVATVGVSYGNTTAQVAEIEDRVAVLERKTLEQLETLNTGVTDIRVAMAKVSADLEWVKDKLQEVR